MPPTAETAPAAANSVEALFAEIDADPDACLDPLSYVEFAQRFRDTEQAQEATRRAEQLRAWSLIDKADPQAIAAFQRTALFPALATKAAQAHTRAMADVAAALRESRQTRKARKARETALARIYARFPQFSVWRDMLESGDAGPEMVIIPAGTFLMGTPEDEPGRFDNEGPQHQVTIDKPFGLGKYAVTYDEYDAYCTATDTAKPDDRGGGRGRRPVTDISWDAIAGPGGFLDWLNAQIAGAPYRLPSEAEWEYAARAGTTTACSFGADPAALDAYAWFAANSEGTPQPVGMTRPNP
jgi:formylglycine-generating enzyme required for sulfatase activity